MKICIRCSQPKPKTFKVSYKGEEFHFCGTCSNQILQGWIRFMILNGLVSDPEMGEMMDRFHEDDTEEF